MAINTSLTELSNQLADAVDGASKSLVTVKGRARQSATGVAYAPGLVLTANHVLERDEDLSILDPWGTSMAAQLVGRDPASDLAVLRVTGLDLPAAGTAAPARTGQLVLALGRPGPMASLGIVSFVGGPLRTGRGLALEQYIRTDATPYPGFSGGPLIDASGAVLGITTTAFGGAALAIPQALAWRVAAALTEHGTPKRGYIGISSQPVRLPAGSAQESGLLVVNVEADSPAGRAGLLLGDILVALDSQPAGDTDDLLRLLTGDRVGKAVKLDVVRGGQPAQVELTVGERS